MKTTLFFTLIISIMAIACTPQKSKPPGQWSEKELSEWFNKGEWKQGWDAQSDESVNQKEFARLYYENPERWDNAFQFLSEQNLA
jgi:murein endopeptidase